MLEILLSEEEVWNSISLTLSHFGSCSNTGCGFPMPHVLLFFLCLLFEARGGCLICWYWWNCWLFTISFFFSLKKHQFSYRATFSLSQRWPLNTGLTVYGLRSKPQDWLHSVCLGFIHNHLAHKQSSIVNLCLGVVSCGL